MRMRIRSVRTYGFHHIYIYTASLNIEYPREWLASLADYRASELIPCIFWSFQKQYREEGGQNKNNRTINLPKVKTFSTDFKYTTQT